MRKIILFELNEVPFRVLDYYADKYPTSHIAKILEYSKQYETKTTDEGHLHPWTTWPTLHRGITNKSHGIKDLGEDLEKIDKSYPTIWQILVQNTVSVGVFSSLHTYPLPFNIDKYKYYVPDPFAAGFETKPKKIEPFQAFNLMMSRASARNVSRKIQIGSGTVLLTTLLRSGVSIQTFYALAKQLVKERTQPWMTTRRRTYQSSIAFDIFFDLLKKENPQFTTFFSNNVASTMHRYWAATFPEDYAENLLDEQWHDRYAHEIDFALGELDQMMKKLLNFIESNPNYKLIIASSMGQAATKMINLETELTLKSMESFMDALGFKKEDWEALPAMHPQYNLKVQTPQVAKDFEKTLRKLKIQDNPINYRLKNELFFSLDLGHVNLKQDFLIYDERKFDLTKFGLENEKVQEQAAGTAYHIPEGSLIIYDPKKKTSEKRQTGIDTTQIAPSILKNFDVQIPDYMNSQTIEEIAN